MIYLSFLIAVSRRSNPSSHQNDQSLALRQLTELSSHLLSLCEYLARTAQYVLGPSKISIIITAREIHELSARQFHCSVNYLRVWPAFREIKPPFLLKENEEFSNGTPLITHLPSYRALPVGQ